MNEKKKREERAAANQENSSNCCNPTATVVTRRIGWIGRFERATEQGYRCRLRWKRELEGIGSRWDTWVLEEQPLEQQ
ncbi:hypothetical protein F0562_007195 [Nyssa sinensis]|uniref:Uncharacterized protein n=1 Tax=Nyssa sinensis TaxID=561372 RepID=A0A5J5A7Q2_9ASTE|nr:hypothetical protein F0562_007195 [Nyssa sinensis]